MGVKISMTCYKYLGMFSKIKIKLNEVLENIVESGGVNKNREMQTAALSTILLRK